MSSLVNPGHRYDPYPPRKETSVSDPEVVVEQDDEPDRSTFLGGSDAAAVMGLSPYMTPVELWEYKTHRKVKDAEATERLRKIRKRGHKLEPFIREMVIEKLQSMGLTVEVLAINARYTHVEHPFLSCEIDFELRLSGEVEIGQEIVLFEGEHVTADAKSVTGFARKKWGEIGTDEVPIEYAAQFMHGLMITGRRWCLVAALRSFDDVDIFWVGRDEETIAAMLSKEVTFWVDHVLADVPPDPVNFADVKLLYPEANPIKEMPVADGELATKVARLKAVRAAAKQLKEEDEVLAFEIGRVIGDAPGVTVNGKPICTWNNERFSRLDQSGLKEKMPDIHAQFNKTGWQRVLRLK